MDSFVFFLHRLFPSSVVSGPLEALLGVVSVHGCLLRVTGGRAGGAGPPHTSVVKWSVHVISLYEDFLKR